MPGPHRPPFNQYDGSHSRGILAELENGACTVPDLHAITGLHPRRISSLLYHLAKKGDVIRGNWVMRDGAPRCRLWSKSPRLSVLAHQQASGLEVGQGRAGDDLACGAPVNRAGGVRDGLVNTG